MKKFSMNDMEKAKNYIGIEIDYDKENVIIK